MTAKRKTHVTIERRASDRTPAAAPPADRTGGYPSIADAARSPALAELMRRAARAAVCAGLVGSVVAAAGCEPPECQPTRWGEMKVHAGGAWRDAASLEVSRALTEVGTGLGISPHSAAPMIMGRMQAVSPAAPAPTAAADGTPAAE